jgi:putative flippase GtrA
MNDYLNPLWWWRFLHRTRYLYFFAVGMTGVAINLGLTAFFAELVFGREHYFRAYLIGLAANLLYNFTLHTLVTFKTKGNHMRRLTIFVLYSLMLAWAQAQLVRLLTDFFGLNWYLVLIASIIFVFSLMTFFLFKFVLFVLHEPPEDMP